MRILNAWWDEWKQEWMIIHENSKCMIQKMGNHARVWSESSQWRPFMQKQCHACNNNEMWTKTEAVLLKANIHKNERKHSLKSSKQHSHEAKHKKQQKRSTRHEKRAYHETTELNVLTSLRCNVGCQSYKVNVRNEICIIWLMSFYKIEVVTYMPQI